MFIHVKNRIANVHFDCVLCVEPRGGTLHNVYVQNSTIHTLARWNSRSISLVFVGTIKKQKYGLPKNIRNVWSTTSNTRNKQLNQKLAQFRCWWILTVYAFSQLCPCCCCIVMALWNFKWTKWMNAYYERKIFNGFSVPLINHAWSDESVRTEHTFSTFIHSFSF